jgi:tetratricopeptide (TPR) repeat protein
MSAGELCHIQISVRIKILIFIFYLPCLLSSSVLAAEQVVLKAQDILSFANHLYRSGEYYRSISEYQRLLYYFPESDNSPEASMQIGRAYMAGGELKSAIEHWEKELEKKTQKKNYLSINTLLGISWLDLKKAKVFTLRHRSLKKAKEYFSVVQGRNPPFNSVRDFLNDWQHLPAIKEKSPWLAGGMSTILPGSGSFYTGRYIEGSYAFLITTLFYLATKDAFAKDQPELGYLFGFFTISFYGGNIYTAVNGAYKYNDYLKAQQLDELRKKQGIWFIPQTHTNQGRF